MNISNLSEIQAHVFPHLLNSNDNLFIVSDSGTGKTLLYAVAAIKSVDASKENVQVLCICATYETAIQTANVIRQVAAHTPIKIGMAVKDEKSTYYDKLL